MWYEKLKSSGFEDVEDGPYLKEWHSCYFQIRHKPYAFKVKQDYYYHATHFLLVHDFDSYLDRAIWELHAKGTSVREIAEEIKHTHTPNCLKTECHIFCPHYLSKTTAINKDKVCQVIGRLRAIFLKYLNSVPDE